MPSLPKRSNLEYEPNSDFYASKQLKKIALQNMKDPLKDIDMNVLSKMDAEKNLKSNLDTLQLMWIDIQKEIIKLSQFVDESAKLLTRGGARPLGAKNKPKIVLGSLSSSPPNISGSVAAPVSSRPSSPSALSAIGSVHSSGSRYSASMHSSARNSVATPSNNGSDDPDDESVSVASFGGPPSIASFGGPPDPKRVISEASAESAISTILNNLINKVQKMDMFVVSKIKPATTKKLSADNQTIIGDVLKKVYKLYDVFKINLDIRITGGGLQETLERFIIQHVLNGDEILTLLKRTIDKLIVDLAICLNAAKQYATTAQGLTTLDTQPENDYVLQLTGFVGAGRHSQGGGRNFYGQVINETRDIPTIRRSYQNNPTKYLL